MGAFPIYEYSTLVKPVQAGRYYFSKIFVQFPEGEGGDQIIEQIFKGPLHVQLRDALRYIKNVIITEKIVKYPDRAESDRFFN